MIATAFERANSIRAASLRCPDMISGKDNLLIMTEQMGMSSCAGRGPWAFATARSRADHRGKIVMWSVPSASTVHVLGSRVDHRRLAFATSPGGVCSLPQSDTHSLGAPKRCTIAPNSAAAWAHRRPSPSCPDDTVNMCGCDVRKGQNNYLQGNDFSENSPRTTRRPAGACRPHMSQL